LASAVLLLAHVHLYCFSFPLRNYFLYLNDFPAAAAFPAKDEDKVSISVAIANVLALPSAEWLWKYLC